MAHDNSDDVATRLRLDLRARGMSIGELARQLGRDKSQVTKWVGGTVIPGPKNARLLAEFFGRPADYFITPRERKPTQAEEIAELRQRIDDLEAQLRGGPPPPAQER